jgi:hypothetical protein
MKIQGIIKDNTIQLSEVFDDKPSLILINPGDPLLYLFMILIIKIGLLMNLMLDMDFWRSPFGEELGIRT